MDESEKKAITPRTRDAKGRFLSGLAPKSPGRPKADPEAKELLRAALPEAARRLVELLHSKKDAVAMKAIEAIFDRTLGKAPQAVSMDVSGSLDMRAQIRAILLERANAARNNTASDTD